MTGPVEALIAVVVLLLITMIAVAQIRRRLPEPEGPFLARTYLATLALRCALAVFLNLTAGSAGIFSQGFWGDSYTYDRGGHLLTLYWSGDVLSKPGIAVGSSGYGWAYFVGFVYYVFGRNQLLVQFVNATLGSLSVVVIYAIAKHIFDVAAARWAARFMAFFPQMIFWSAALYKDTATILAIATAIYAVLRLAEVFSMRHLMLYVAAGLALMTLRFYVFYFIVFATLGTFLFSQRRGFLGSLVTQAVFVGVFLGAFSFAAGTEAVEQHSQYFTMERLQITREDQARWGQSAFEERADVSTVGGAITTLPIGLVYLLFAPFPWQMGSLRQMLVLPETLVWYALFPALVRGIRYTIRTRLRVALPVLVFAGALTMAYAVYQGNVGTAYRQRTQITMFFFVFMGAGLVQKQRLKERRAAAAQGAVRSLNVPAFRR